MSSLRKAFGRAGTLLLTLTVAALAAGGVAGVQVLLSSRAESLPPPPRPAPVPVGVVLAEPAAGYRLERRFTGRIAPAETTQLAFETGGRIAWVGPREGARVAAGEVVARLDTAALAAERAAAEADRAALTAQAELARLTLARQQGLADKGHSPTRALDEARLGLAALEAQIAGAAARIAAIDVALDKALLRAPFAAEVGTRHLDPGATAGAGLPVLTLMSLAPPELRAGLPPDLAATLSPGAALRVEVQGRTLPARLVRLRPDLSPATRTREAVAALEAGAGRPPYGEAAALVLVQEVREPGFWVPLPALRDGPRGTWTVLLAEDDGQGGLVARPETVEVLHAEPTRAFVRGALAPGARILADGAHRVIPGQPVAPLPDAAAPLPDAAAPLPDATAPRPG